MGIIQWFNPFPICYFQIPDTSRLMITTVPCGSPHHTALMFVSKAQDVSTTQMTYITSHCSIFETR